MDARDYRCCMCPQIDMDKYICPTGPGKSKETQCDFVVVWLDNQGWKYKVLGDPDGTYRVYYQDDKHEGSGDWREMHQMKYKETFDQAQEELNCYAKLKGWHVLYQE